MNETYKTMVEVDCPVGYEVERHGVPSRKDGELVILSSGRVSPSKYQVIAPRIILRKSFVWPDWLPDSFAAIAKDQNEKFYAYPAVPTRGPIEWSTSSLTQGHFRLGCDGVDLPHGLESVLWQDSLRLNPNHKDNQ